MQLRTPSDSFPPYTGQDNTAFPIPSENSEGSSVLCLLRRAVPGDAAQVQRIISEALEVYCRASSIHKSQLAAGQEGIPEIEKLIGESLFFVAETQERIVGTVRLTFPEWDSLLPADGTHGRICYISRYYVDPAYHSKGIGNRLLRLAFACAEQEKAGTTLLHTALANKPMIEYYTRKGFTLLSENHEGSYPRGLFCKMLP